MIGIGTLLASAWRANHHAPAFVETIPSNYGTAGSLTHWRDRRTDLILAPTAGQDPRLKRFNGVLPIVWRLRVVDDAKIAAVANRAPATNGQPASYTPPRVASLGSVLK